MLIEFKVGNFRSFKDIVTLSMVASPDKEHIETNTVELNKKLKLLRSTVIYGANASGKSNLFKAMAFMRYFALNSSKETQVTDQIDVERFRLSTAVESEPSSFEVTFLIDNTRYRYGFQIDENKVHNEWLFYVPSTREAVLFTRENGKTKLGGDFKEGKGLESKTRDNALFLSVAAQFNGEIAIKVLKWIQNFKIISGLELRDHEAFTVFKMDDKKFMEFSTKFLKVADLGIKEFMKEEKPMSIDDFPRSIPKKLEKKIMSMIETGAMSVEINTLHQKFDESNKPLSDEHFSLNKHESAGTRAFFSLSAPIYDTLKNDGVLVVDELTSQLHPLLTRAIIEAFHNYKHPGGNAVQSRAQLIFASHDTSILTNQLFRRDQVWFTQKDDYGATELYSLEEYRIRKDASFNKDYMMGKYKGVPYIGNIDSLFPLL